MENMRPFGMKKAFGEAELKKEPNIHRQKNGGVFAVDQYPSQSMAFLSWLVTVHCQPTANCQPPPYFSYKYEK